MSRATRGIASRERVAYLRAVSLTRLIRFLTILAVIFVPLGMIGATPAMAHQAAMAGPGQQMTGHAMPVHQVTASMAAMDHCKDMDKKSKDQPCGSGDCVMACAAVPAIPAMGGQLDPHAVIHGPRQQPALVSVPHGLVPEAATPPPRKLLTI